MNEHFYETGSTQPPKSRVLTVLLLVLLIFTGGIITALGILNIKLWNAFSPQKKEAVSLRFTREESHSTPQFFASDAAETGVGAGLGIVTQTVSPFMRAYYSLPQGVFLSHVTEGSPADAAGILPGDILLAVDGQKITDTDTLSNLLCRYHAGDVMTLTLQREGQKCSAMLTVTEETE